MRSLKLSLLSLSLVAGLSSTAAAQQVNFDDLTGFLSPIANGYAGLNWNNAFVMHPGVVYGAGSAGGFSTVLSSGDRVLGNNNADALTISGSSFNLVSGRFAAAWTNGLTLNVKGFAGSTQLYNKNFILDWSNPTTLALNLFGVDNVVFSSFGGTVAPEWLGNNQSFAADNLEFSRSTERLFSDEQVLSASVVPEPSTYALMAAGLLALGGIKSRRRNAAKK